MTDTMIERLVEAAQSATFDAHVHRCSVSITGKDTRAYHEHVARAVLAAMREPTAAMVDAGFQFGETTSYPLEGAWANMIAAALAEGA